MDNNAGYMTRKMMYGLPVVLAIMIGGLLYFMGDTPDIIVMKLTVLPLYLLAGRAIDILLPGSEDATPPLKLLERLFLDAFLVACFMTVLIWNPGKSAGDIVVSFLVFILVYTGAMFLLRTAFRKKASHHS